MQSLQVVQRNFSLMGLDPNRKPLNQITLTTLILAMLGIFLQWIFLIQGAENSQERMESIYIATAYIGTFLSFASTIFIQKELFLFINNFDELTNERLKTPNSKAICEETNQLVEKYSEIGLFVMKYVIAPSFILPKAIISFYNYFETDLGSDAFALPASIWLPIDWKNPVLYLMTVCGEVLWAVCLLHYLGCFIFLAFGVFMFAISFVKDMKRKSHAINKMASNKKSRGHMYQKMSKFIHLHARAKQLFDSFSGVYEITLTILFVSCIIAISVAMLVTQMEILHNETDSIILLEVSLFGVAASILLLFVCELGQRFSNSIGKMDDVISQLDWYLYPDEIKRILPLLMLNSQKPAVIKCFGSVLCSRKQFLKVMKTIYSYFMVLREFYK